MIVAAADGDCCDCDGDCCAYENCDGDDVGGSVAADAANGRGGCCFDALAIAETGRIVVVVEIELVCC